MTARSNILSRLRGQAEPIDWEAVYAEYLPRVYNFFRFRVGDDALAEDLTAATFEQAWRARARYRADLGGVSTWLFTIARRIGTDHFRRRRVEVRLEQALEQTDGVLPEEVVERRLELARLGALLADLPVREQELIALKYGAGLTNRAIAGVAGLSESNVGTILHRVVQRLGAAWEHD